MVCRIVVAKTKLLRGSFPISRLLIRWLIFFAGGCAVTHAALLSGKWSRIVANDIGDAPQPFMDAIHGKYDDEKRWISREDFHRLKDSDPYVSLCWSFGNNRTDYLYAKDIEPWKKALHYARVFGDTSLLREFGIDSDGSREDIKKNQAEYQGKYAQWYGKNIRRMNSLERVQNLERLQSLQSLNNSKRMQALSALASPCKNIFYRLDYREVTIPPNAIVYADPPYRNTRCTGYKCSFDHRAFEQWLAGVPFMVIVSGYEAPAGCKEIAHTNKQLQISTGNGYGCGVEKLFVQERFAEQYQQMMGRF